MSVGLILHQHQPAWRKLTTVRWLPGRDYLSVLSVFQVSSHGFRDLSQQKSISALVKGLVEAGK